MKKMSKKDLVLQHLQSRPITSMEAIELYRNTRLADSVFVLRKEGHNITTKTIKTENGSYAEYRLEKQDEQTPIQNMAGEGSLRLFPDRQDLF